jgi:hypothetical protein
MLLMDWELRVHGPSNPAFKVAVADTCVDGRLRGHDDTKLTEAA